MKYINAVVLLTLISVSGLAEAMSFTTSGNSILALRTGHDLNIKRLELIKSANSFIYLKTFIINRDPSEGPVFEALCERAKEGLDVRMLIDDLGRTQGGNPIKKKKGDYSMEWFKSCGIRLERYGKPSWGPLDYVLYSQHDKMLINEKMGIIGGTNYSRDYSAHGQFSKQWYDFDIAVEGPSTCSLQTIFRTSWVRAYEQELKGIKALSTKNRRAHLNERFSPETLKEKCEDDKVMGEESITILWNDPNFSKERPFEDFVISSLDKVLKESPEKIVSLYAPYLIPNKKVLAKMVEVAKAGVRIRIITNSATSIDPEAFQAYVAMLLRVKPLLAAGVEISMWSPMYFGKLEKDNVFHKKGGCFAKIACYIGSHNLDVRGDKYSSELMAVLTNPDMIDERATSYEDDLRFTLPLTEDDRQDRLKNAKITDRLIAKLIGWAM